MGTGPAACAAAICATCLAAPAVWGDPIPVNYSVEYQHVDGAAGIRDLWSQNVDANYSRRLQPDLQLSSQFRLNRLTSVGRPEKIVTPYGDLRLLSSTYGLATSYRPSATTDRQGLTTRENQAQISGFVARPGLPRLDVLWTRRETRPEDASVHGWSRTRSARLGWVVGGLELRGGAGDVLHQAEVTSVSHTRESNWNGGATFRRARSNWSFQAAGDITGLRRTSDIGFRQVSRSGNVGLDFTQRISPRSDWSATYQFQSSRNGDGIQQRLTTQEGSVTGNYRPTRATALLVAAGVRPLSTPSGSMRSLGYAVATATAKGRVRSGWQGLASASQTLNRDPAGHWYGTSSLRASSVLALTRRMQVNLDGTVTANGDTTQRDSRIGMQTQAGLTASPLRTWTITASVRGYRVGPSFETASAHSLGRTIGIAWQPSSKFDLRGSFDETGALPHGTPRVNSRLVQMRYAASSRFQLDAQVSSSNTTRLDANSGYLPGSEAWSGHLLAALGRRYNLRVGGAVVDPGKPTRSRQVDVTLTGHMGGGS